VTYIGQSEFLGVGPKITVNWLRGVVCPPPAAAAPPRAVVDPAPMAHFYGTLRTSLA
jgi:hypothetical protein